MDTATAVRGIDAAFTTSIVPCLEAYIRMPNTSPVFDRDWQAHGHMDRAATLLLEWCRAQPVRGLTAEIVRLPTSAE